MIYDEDDFNFSMPVIDPKTPHEQVPWKELFMAVQERTLVNYWGKTPDQAAKMILEKEALHNRALDPELADTGFAPLLKDWSKLEF